MSTEQHLVTAPRGNFSLVCSAAAALFSEPLNRFRCSVCDRLRGWRGKPLVSFRCVCVPARCTNSCISHLPRSTRPACRAAGPLASDSRGSARAPSCDCGVLGGFLCRGAGAAAAAARGSLALRFAQGLLLSFKSPLFKISVLKA